MRMIPSQILRKDSSAETSIFKMLQELDLGLGAVALHSLNLPRHEYKKWAEADFVILCSQGILLLEVKGGGVACRDGMWEFSNRYGEISRKRESPAVQAKTAFFALRDNYLLPAFEEQLWNLPAGWAVVFKDIAHLVNEGPHSLPDQPSEITAFSGSCVGYNTFGKFIKSSLSYWAGTLIGQPRSLSAGAIAKMVTSLRPDFEQVPPLARRIEEFNEDVTKLTLEQYERLDELQENDRLLIRGGAGTGKTFLAMACARYDNAQQHDVLVTTRSEPLVDYLLSTAPTTGIDIVAYGSLSERLQRRGRPWDVLIIDEGQDLCQLESLDNFSLALKGGLETGRWRWFGDPNRQVSPSFPLELTALEYLEGLSMKRNLKQNIRNTAKIVETIQRYSGADLGTPACIGQGAAARFQELKDGEETCAIVATIVGSWTSGDTGVARSDVAVLVHSLEEISLVVDALKKARIRAERLRDRGSQNRNSVVVSTVEDFKGLERPLVCIAGLGPSALGPELRGRIYRALSRANHTLAVVYTKCEAKQLRELEHELLKQKSVHKEEKTWLPVTS